MKPSLSLDGTYGWRARIGFITVAATVETPVHEFYMVSPPGIVLVSMGLTVTTVDKESVDRVTESLSAAASELAKYRVDHIVVSGNPVAYMSASPTEKAQAIEAIVSSASGVPSTFEWTATLEALRHVGALRIAVATPFTDEHNSHLRRGLEADGFEVAAIVGMGLVSNPDITTQPVGSAYRTAREAFRRSRNADAVYIACPRWPVVPAIQPLEDELGVPVIASVPAWLWSVSRQLGIGVPVVGFGGLLSGVTAGEP